MPEYYHNLRETDPAMTVPPADGDGIKWYLPFEKPMQLSGFAWFDKYRTYHRLPDELPLGLTQFYRGEKRFVPAADSWGFKIALHTAGGQIRFRTNAVRFHFKGKMLETGGMDHMALTGSAGFDIYQKCNGLWRFVGVTRTDHSKLDFSCQVITGLEPEMRDVIINFPLYNGVSSLAIGLDEDARIEMPLPFRDPRPIVWYGTSIQQGGCATRPGMAAGSILSRMLDREVMNLGFSGSGKGEPEMAALLADIKDPGMYLVDYCWNVDVADLRLTLPRFIDILREAHPEVPIVLVSPTPGRYCLQEVHQPDIEGEAEVMREEMLRRKAAGDVNIHYFDALHCALGSDPWECAVDGVHLTDMGFYRLVQAMYPFLLPLFC